MNDQARKETAEIATAHEDSNKAAHPKKATWSVTIPTFREPTPEEQAEGKTCDDKVVIEVPSDQLDGYFRATSERAVGEQVRAILEHQLGGIREDLVAAVRAANDSPEQPTTTDGEDVSPGVAKANGDPDTDAGMRVIAALGRSVRGAPPEDNGEKSAPETQSRFMRPKGYSNHRGVSMSTVKRWLRLGIPHQRLGPRLISIDVEAADEWLRSGGAEVAVKKAAVIKARTRRAS